MEYSSGLVDFLVYRNFENERANVPGVGTVYLPEFILPGAGSEEKVRFSKPLKLRFLSIKDAAGAMKYSGVQMISIFAAEQRFNTIDRTENILRIRHEIKAELYSVSPDYVSSGGSLDPDSSSDSSVTLPCHAVCKYGVSYYAAYAGDEKLWEIDPAKRLCEVAGIRYPLPSAGAK